MNAKKYFTDLFLKGWKQKLCKVLDNDTIRIEKEMDNPNDFEITEIVKLRKAIQEDIEIKSTELSLKKIGNSRFDAILSEVFTFTPAEFWELLINFGCMTGAERKEFFEEYELRIYKGKTMDENMID